MVAGGAEEGENRVQSSEFRVRSEKRVYCVEQAAYSQAGDLVGPGGEPGIGVELRMRPAFRLRDGPDVKGIMDEREFVLCGKTGRDKRQGVKFGVDEIVDDAEAVRTFRMTFAGDVLQIPIVFDDGKRRHDSNLWQVS
jgi:hypothetical protein